MNLDEWFSELIKKSSFHTEWISLSKSSSWHLRDGRISHKSGRFFSIVGIEYKDNQGITQYQPFIEQKEIGTLGFLMRDTKKGKEILVQAKIEPGNVEVVQLAPTCQATKSNLLRIHGGKNPPFSHVFADKHLQIIKSSLQSEQGSRFFGKQNSNIIALIKQKLNLPDTHRWLSIDNLLNLLSKDYLVNTDARSVLVTSPWDKLVDRPVFSRYKDDFSKDLARSYKEEINTAYFKRMKNNIVFLRQKDKKARIIPLNKMKNWEIKEKEIKPLTKKPFRVRFLKVVAKNREVPEWDQPIIDSYSEGRVDLVCGRIRGVLHFLFKPVEETGLYNNIELSPTLCVEPGENKKIKNIYKGRVMVSVKQSDEGGRFYQDSTRYSITDMGEASLKLGGYWLNLKQIQNLLFENGWLTNEARSVLSLLLYWL